MNHTSQAADHRARHLSRRWLGGLMGLLCLLILGNASAQVAFRAAGSNAASGIVAYRAAGAIAIGTNGSDITPALPAGTVYGDLLVLVTVLSGSTSALPAPTGWTLLQQNNDGGNGNPSSAAVFYRFAPVTPTAPTLVNPTGSSKVMGRIISFVGADPVTPIGASGMTVTLNGTTTNAPAVAGGTANAAMLVVTNHIDDNCSSTGSPTPGSWTTAFSNSNTNDEDAAIAAHYRLQTSSGTQSAITFTRSGCTNDDSYGVQFVINPVSSGLSLPVPAGTLSGDVMLATVTARPGGTSVGTPSGWTLLASNTQSNGVGATMSTYWRMATASEPASYVWPLSGTATTGIAGGVLSFSGADPSAPIDVYATALTNSSFTHTAPSVVTTVAETMLVTSHAFQSTTSGWTPPAGMTEAVDISSQAASTSGISMEMNYLTIALASSTGTRSAVAASGSSGADFGTTHSIAIKPPPLLPLADYHMDETGWNGTANEVADSSGNGYHGRAAYAAGSGPTAEIASGSPAFSMPSQNRSSCNYGLFDRTTAPIRTHTYVELSNFPSLTSSHTIGAWIRSSDVSAPNQRIMVRDDNNANGGWGFSLADGGSGRLRVFNRAVTNQGAVTGDGIDPNCGVFCIDTNAVIANNTWYYVAFTLDATPYRVEVYVFNSVGVRIAKTTGYYSGASGTAWGAGSGLTAIGGETSASTEGLNSTFHFKGNIDEVQVFDRPLTEAQLYTQLQRTRVCPNLDHAELVHNGEALTCTPKPVTVLGCTTGVSCYGSPASQVTSSFSITPNAIAGAQWCLDAVCASPFTGIITVNNGDTIYLRNPNVSTVQMGGSSTGVNTTLMCRNTSTAQYNSTTACNVDYAAAGLLLNAVNHYACDAQTITIQAVKASATGTTCVPAFANVNRDLTMYMSYVNPSSGTLSPSFDYITSSGGATSSIGALSTNALTPTALSNLYWNASGTATLTHFRYADVGRVQLNPVFTGSGSTSGLTLNAISGNQFTAAPKSFAFSNISAGPIGAGNPFSATVTALNNCPTPSATPNFGKELVPESVALTLDSRVAPAGTNNCTNGPCSGVVSGNVGTWSAGAATATNLSYTEVGQITLAATLASANYLGSGLTASGISSTVGNFVPAYFDTTVTPGCGGFTYSAQPFTATATAKNALGNTTVNYSHLPPCTVCSQDVTLSDAGATANFNGTNTIAAASFAQGSALTNTVAYSFPVALTAPATITVRATDASGASSAGHTEGTTQIRRGRLRLSNVFGTERQTLQMPLQTQYWSGQTWVLSNTDNCTSLAPGNFFLSSGITTASGVSFSNGSGTLTLTAPGANTTGSVDIAANLGLAGNDQSCLASHGGSPASRPWLRSLNGNCAATYDRDPSARATFGIYAPETRRTIHVRELY